MAGLSLPLSEVGVFLAILLRLSLVFFLLPVFGGQQIPNAVKAGFSISLSVFFFFVLHRTVTPLPFEPLLLVLAVLGELAFAVVLALSMMLVFAAFQFAGELIGFQMGLGFAQVADPESGTQMMIFSRWFQLVAVLLLLSLNGHHIILKAIAESFETVPIGSFALSHVTYVRMMALAGYMFVVAIKIAAPVMVVLMLMHVAMGLMAKFSPQVNILMVSFPITILLGLVFMVFSVSVWVPSIERFLGKLMQFLQGFV